MPQQFRQTTTFNPGGGDFQNIMSAAQGVGGLMGGVGDLLSQGRKAAQDQALLDLRTKEMEFDKGTTFLKLADTVQNVSAARMIAEMGYVAYGLSGDPLKLAVNSYISSSVQQKEARGKLMSTLSDPKMNYKEKTLATIEHGLMTGLPIKEQINGLLNEAQKEEWFLGANDKHNQVQTLMEQKIEALYSDDKMSEDKYKAARAGTKTWGIENLKYLKGQLTSEPEYTLPATATDTRDLVGAIVAEAEGQFLSPRKKTLLGKLSPVQKQQLATSETQEYKGWIAMATKIKPSRDDPKYIDSPDQYMQDILTFADQLQDPAEREKIKTETGIDVSDPEIEDNPNVFKRVWDAVFSSKKQKATSTPEYEYKQDPDTGKWYKRKKK